MQVSVEKTNTFERRLTVEIPQERIDQEVQKRLKSLARTTKIKGFRAGKVPLRMLEKKYGKQARQEAIGEIVQSSFTEATQQHNFNIVDQPTIDVKNNEGGSISYTADFAVLPTADSIEIEGFAVEKPVAEIQESDIDAMLEKLRKQRQKWNEIQGPAELGDEVHVDYVGNIGEATSDQELQQAQFVLGNQASLPGLDEALVGSNVGDRREVDVTFPEEYKESELAGNTAHFTVDIKKIMRAGELPEIDDDFIKSFGVEGDTIESLRQGIRENLEQSLLNLTRNRIKRQVLNTLLLKNPIKVPKAVVDSEIQRLTQAKEYAQDAQTNLALNEILEKEATVRVQLGMLIKELIKANPIQASPEKIRALIEEFAEAYEDPKAAIDFFYKDQQRLREVEAIVLENEVVDLLLKKAEITEKKMSFYELTEESNY